MKKTVKTVRIVVSGKVQGVFYRHNCKKAADSLNIKGTVRNLDSGHVEVIAQGDTTALNKLIEWCRKGPMGAVVDDVSTEDVEEEMTVKEFDGFEIIY